MIHMMCVPIYPLNKDNTGKLLPCSWTHKKPLERCQRHVCHLYSVHPKAMHFAVVFWRQISTMNPIMSRWKVSANSVTGSMYLLSYIWAWGRPASFQCTWLLCSQSLPNHPSVLQLPKNSEQSLHAGNFTHEVP